jgi:hypothetical protein
MKSQLQASIAIFGSSFAVSNASNGLIREIGILQFAAASSSVVIAQGAPCTGAVAYCAASNIILRCNYGYLQAGNCNDNLDEPPLGALCVDSAPAPGGSATCVAITSSTSSAASVTTTSSTKSPSASPTIAPGATCTGAVAYCVGGSGGSDIILRCSASGTLEPGNCADNLDEPPLGAVCVDPAPPPGGMATCSAITAPTSSSSSASSTKGQSSSHASPTGGSSSASSTQSHGSGSTSPTHSTSTKSNVTVATATPAVFTGVAAAMVSNWHFEVLAAIGALLVVAL